MTDAELGALRSRALAMPGATEDEPWEDHAAWKVGGKMFALIGSQKNGVFLYSTKQRQEALLLHPAVKFAPYLGRHGWVVVSSDEPDWLELALELMLESYEGVVAKLPKSKRPIA